MSPSRKRPAPKRKTRIEPLIIVRNKAFPDPRLEYLAQQSQEVLARFLAIEIEIGVTYIELAKTIKMRGEPERQMALKKHAEVVAGSVKRFKDRLHNNSREHIENQLAELERAISSL